MGAYGMYKMANSAKGGQIKEKRMADGGITQLFDVGGAIKSDLYQMEPQDLQKYIQESSSPTAKKMAQQILAEKSFMAKQQQSAGVTQLPSNLPVGEPMGAAAGGIIAFADEGAVKDRDPGAATFERLIAEKEAAANEDTTASASGVERVEPTGVDTLIAPPPTRLPSVGATSAVNPKESVYGGIPLMSPEAKESFSQYSQLYKDLRSDTPKAREEAKWMAIMQAGLGIAGGTSPNALANISQGAQPALAQYQSAIKDIRKDDREALKGLVDLGLKKEEFIQRAEKMGIDKYTADKVFEAHKYSADMQLKAAQARAAAEKQPKSITEGDITDKQIQNGILIDRLMEKAKTGPLTDPEKDALANAQSSNKYYMSILETKRPVAPSAAIPNAITGAIDKDRDLKILRLAQIGTDDSKEKAAIQLQIDTLKKEIAAEVRSGSSPGRGIPAAGSNPTAPAAPAAPAVNAPSLSDFLTAARKVNPNASDEQLKAYYTQKYGR
jgi:hypothetical protein